MNYDLLTKQAEAFVTKYMQKHDNPRLLFHNFQLTQNIVNVAGQIAKQYSLDEKDTFIVMATAWFLNIGYYKDILEPGEASVKMADEFLKKSGVEIETIESIKKCMLVTKATSAPETLIEKIMRDASTFYLGSENFPGYNKLHFKEAELLNADNKNEWKKNTILLLESHQFYTDYCQSRLNAQKQQNLETLQKKYPLLSLTPHSIDSMFEEVSEISGGRKKGKVKDKDMEKDKEIDLKSAERTIETMFKTTSVNSQRLSSQADTKAHIMISVNTIIISAIVSFMLKKMEDNSRLIFPIITILVVGLVTIIFSILATRPNISKKYFSEADLKDNKINMLFFGNFFTMDFDNYRSTMLNLMSDQNDLYTTLLRNLYEQGIVLARKYRMLKISYNVFMYGLVFSVIAFFWAYK